MIFLADVFKYITYLKKTSIYWEWKVRNQSTKQVKAIKQLPLAFEYLIKIDLKWKLIREDKCGHWKWTQKTIHEDDVLQIFMHLIFRTKNAIKEHIGSGTIIVWYFNPLLSHVVFHNKIQWRSLKTNSTKTQLCLKNYLQNILSHR